MPVRPDKEVTTDSPGPAKIGEAPVAAIAGSGETTKIEIRPELKPDILPAKSNGASVVPGKPVQENVPNGGPYGRVPKKQLRTAHPCYRVRKEMCRNIGRRT